MNSSTPSKPQASAYQLPQQSRQNLEWPAAWQRTVSPEGTKSLTLDQAQAQLRQKLFGR